MIFPDEKIMWLVQIIIEHLHFHMFPKAHLDELILSWVKSFLERGQMKS